MGQPSEMQWERDGSLKKQIILLFSVYNSIPRAV